MTTTADRLIERPDLGATAKTYQLDGLAPIRPAEVLGAHESFAIEPSHTMPTPAPAPALPKLLAELVELGREAWRISERERVVRAEIETLYEAEENQ